MRRLALVPAVLIVALVVALPAAARPSIETNQREWEIPSGQCPNLAPGTSLSGSGTETSITTLRTSAGGITTISNATHTHGTSTDDAGNVYVFDYSNEFRASNTAADPDIFTGLMTDHFSNSGSGPAKLNNGFVANITFTLDFSIFVAEPISSHGDPLDFTDGTAACDPL